MEDFRFSKTIEENMQKVALSTKKLTTYFKQLLLLPKTRGKLEMEKLALLLVKKILKVFESFKVQKKTSIQEGKRILDFWKWKSFFENQINN